MLAPSALLARRYVAASTRSCRRRSAPSESRAGARWAWLVEGAAQWLSGQTRHIRPAVARRLREGPSPAFPPSRADALLLGGSVFDLLAREEGDRACVTLARGPHPDGPIRALEIAFPRSVRHTEDAWRSHLSNGSSASRRTATATPAANDDEHGQPRASRRAPDPGAVALGGRRAGSRGRRAARARRPPGGGDHDVARAGGEEVRHVEAARAAREQGDALLEQQALDELGLGLVARPGGADQRAFGVARVDLAGALGELGALGLLRQALADERQPAASCRSARVTRALPRRKDTRARRSIHLELHLLDGAADDRRHHRSGSDP